MNGYPTTVFVNSDGHEVDRIVGYRPPDKFVTELNRIHKNIDTVDDLLTRTKETPNNLDLWKMLADKYDERGDLQNALDVWWKISKLGSEDRALVEYKLAFYNTRINQSVAELETYIQANPDTEFLGEAYNTIVRIHRKNQAKQAEARVYSDYVKAMESRGKSTPNLLNGYAWRMTELELNLEDALDKIRMAVKKIEGEEPESQAQIMDTEAEVLWKLGKTDDAIEVIDECIALQPEDEYYQKQKAKFLGEGG